MADIQVRSRTEFAERRTGTRDIMTIAESRREQMGPWRKPKIPKWRISAYQCEEKVADVVQYLRHMKFEYTQFGLLKESNFEYTQICHVQSLFTHTDNSASRLAATYALNCGLALSGTVNHGLNVMRCLYLLDGMTCQLT